MNIVHIRSCIYTVILCNIRDFTVKYLPIDSIFCQGSAQLLCEGARYVEYLHSDFVSMTWRRRREDQGVAVAVDFRFTYRLQLHYILATVV
jgi:hypothetical protein